MLTCGTFPQVWTKTNSICTIADWSQSMKSFFSFFSVFSLRGVNRAVESLPPFCYFGHAYLYFLSFQRSLFNCKLRVLWRELYCISHLQLFTLCYQYFPTNMQFRGCYADTNANGYIMLLFHYSARFLKSIKSPFCRCSYSLPAQSCLYSAQKRSLDILSPEASCNSELSELIETRLHRYIFMIQMKDELW